MAQIKEGWTDGEDITDPETGISIRLSSHSVLNREDMEITSEYRMTIDRPGLRSETREAVSTEKIISRNLLLDTLRENHFRVIEQWGEYDRKPYHDGDRRIIILSEKVAAPGDKR